MLTEDQQLMKFNLGTDVEQMVKINVSRNRQSARSGAIVKGIQRCFYMDIQRFERDSTKASITQN
jgi:hypothetical protein